MIAKRRRASYSGGKSHNVRLEKPRAAKKGGSGSAMFFGFAVHKCLEDCRIATNMARGETHNYKCHKHGIHTTDMATNMASGHKHGQVSTMRSVQVQTAQIRAM